MASSKIETSPSNTSGVYQVFLSFRGPDTRHGFTNCLYHALVAVGIHVFVDDEELRPGERLSDSLLGAIDDSKLYIPIFSKKYASSHWCLRELAKIVENSKSNENGKVILPIFYDVEPSDVKLKTTLYSKAISDLAEEIKDQKKKFSFEDVETWRQALKEVNDTKGFKLEDYSRNHGDLIKAVVDEVLDRLQMRQRPVPENLVGMEDCIAAIDKLLDIDSKDVRLIVIYGMGGIGKTTLTNVIFNKLCPCFEKNCSFLGDVREMAKTEEGLVKLQEKLLSDISYFKVDRKIDSSYNGMRRIGETICSKKMLIVLDDVDEGTQIKNLIGVNSLYDGTRILVTTRDKSIINDKEFKYMLGYYEMVGLSDEDALRLFSRHAFDDYPPEADYFNLSKGIVRTADGLPLALKVIGSYLYKKNKAIWEEWLKKLRETPHDGVLPKLRISYDALNMNQKQIFLDIACFFVGQNKTNPIYMWQDCAFFPVDAIDVLTQRCMIKVLTDDRFWMHDQMRDLGRKIAKEENTRLWDTNDIICKLRSTEINRSVQALRLRVDRMTITSEQIKRFPHIRFLWLSGVTCQGDFMGYLSELRWIYLSCSYRHFTRDRLEATALLHLENAVVVNLSGMDITGEAFKCLIKGARKLKVLTIMHNVSMNRTPTFPEYSDLEELAIHDSNLMESDCSIGNLRSLTCLSIQRIHELRKLPEQIGELHNLRPLSLRFCLNLIELPNLISKLESLTNLNVSGTRNTRLPDSIGRLSSLSSVNETSTPIEKLPSTMSKLLLLQTLELDPCNSIQELPKLPRSLTILRLTSGSLQTIPNLSYLTNLVELCLSGGYQCGNPSNEFQTDDLGWIGSLTKLSKLHVCFPNVRAPTAELCSLSLLKELTLCGLDLPTFKQLSSNLIVLELYETRGIFPPSEKETPFLPTS